MLDKLLAAAEHIRRFESLLRERASTLRGSTRLFQDAIDKEMIMPIELGKADGLVAAIDGGLLAEEMHGADIVLSRAVAAVFGYKDSVLVSHEYYPNAFPEPDYEVKTGLDEREIMSFRALFRLGKEIDCAIEALEKYGPRWLMLDGSLLPLSADKPLEEGEVHEYYLQVVAKYRRLYSMARERGCVLLGVIKDSRSKRFLDIVRNEVDVKASDSSFLSHLLKEGERTFAFRYTSDIRRHPVAKDFGEDAQNVYAMYLRPVENDRPLRVEFLGGTKSPSQIATFVNALASINRTYAYPAVLIEADLRAAMDPLELERAKKSLTMQIGGGLMQLRRNSRPFR